MSRSTAKADNSDRVFEICDLCGYFLDGARNCGWCGEPQCPICGCLCGASPGELDEDGDEDEDDTLDDEEEQW